MCGLAGVVALDHARSQAFVTDAVATHACRGPDHSAILTLPGGITLAHNRLSIIDLSKDANQPLWDEDRNRCIVLNGEIYNYIELRTELSALGYRFHTTSDTEVLLAAFQEWGEASLARLMGMFAFAICEPSSGRVWLARDRFGVKPLYYRHAGGAFRFSSTPGPIARAEGCEPNLQYVARGLQYWLYETDDGSSPYQGVQSVPPGHLLEVQMLSDGRISVTQRRYYRFEDRVRDQTEQIMGLGDADLLDLFDQRFDRAVELRLRADVPVGVALSGGLDSSSILAAAASKSAELTGFTFGDPTVDGTEGRAVESIARHLGVRTHYIWPSVDELIRAYDETIEAQDAPFNDASVVAQFLVYRAARAAGVKVVMGGQGADEMLMGYRKYQMLAVRDAWRRRDLQSTASRLGDLAKMLGAEFTQSSVYLSQLRRYIGKRGMVSMLSAETPPMDLVAAGVDSRGRQLLDVARFSLPTLLRYEDRNSMGNGVESRLPFMDHELAELCIALPISLKLRRGYGKWVLRRAMMRRLPRPIVSARRKIGFTVLQDRWVRLGLGDHIRSRIKAHPEVCTAYLARGTHVDTAFTDDRLARNATTFGDATALIWLSASTP